MRKRVSFGSLPIGAEFQRAYNGSWWRKVKMYWAYSHTQQRALKVRCESCGINGQVTAGEIEDDVQVWVKEE